MLNPVANVVGGTTNQKAVAVAGVVPTVTPLPQSNVMASVDSSPILTEGTPPKVRVDGIVPFQFAARSNPILHHAEGAAVVAHLTFESELSVQCTAIEQGYTVVFRPSQQPAILYIGAGVASFN